jgi:alpha-amylase
VAQHLVTYTVVHQPRRLKLPAQPIPPGISFEDLATCLFDEAANKRYFAQVAEKCYYPATRVFLEQVEAGFKLSIGFSISFLRQCEMWDQELYGLFRQLVAHPNVELVGVDPYHTFLFYVDIEEFVRRMQWMAGYFEHTFGRRPRVTDTTEMFMSNDIYHAVRRAGFQAAVMDGREWVLNWRDASYLYHYQEDCKLFCRHHKLSDDVGYRFSNKGWESWPLSAGTYAHWIREQRGDMVFIGWDYETFGEHHWADTGIFDFMRFLPGELKWRGMEFATPSEALQLYGHTSHHLPLPEFPTTWAGSGGVEFFLGNSAQQAVFQLMHHAYSKAKLTGRPELIDLALWLLQSDNLHLIQWFGRVGQEAEVSAYFTPREWWSLGPVGIITELQQVYKNFIRALDAWI